MDAAGLRAKVEAGIATAMPEIGKRILKDTTEKYKSVIDEFYGEYTPKKYDRMWDLVNTYDEVLDVGSTSVTVGITLNPGAISPSHDSPEYVFSGAFGMGIHGTSSIMVGSPGRGKMDSWHEQYSTWIPFWVVPLIVSHIKF